MKNEARGFAALFQQHFTGVLSAVQRFGVHPRNAEDVAQDVFLNVFESLHRYDSSRPLKSWLKTITYRTARDHIELGRTRERLTSRGQVDSVEPAPNPEQSFFVKQALETLVEVLQSLDTDCRAVFLMAEFEQCTQPEIAQALGIRESTVQSRLRRAHEDFEKAVCSRRMVVEELRSSSARLPFARRSCWIACPGASRRAL